MTGKHVFFASAAHQIESAQFFDHVGNAEPTTGPVPSKLAGKQILSYSAAAVSRSGTPGDPTLYGLPQSERRSTALAPGGNFCPRGMYRRRVSFCVKRS
jgi:hypothetical protein